MLSWMMREIASVAPPGGNGTISVIGLAGIGLRGGGRRRRQADRRAGNKQNGRQGTLNDAMYVVMCPPWTVPRLLIARVRCNLSGASV